MLIWTARVSKKKTAVITAVILVAVLAVVVLVGNQADPAVSGLPQLADNDARVSYLQSMGWEVDPEPVETLQFLLPEKLEEPYLTYNELQDSQGFDLSTACGKQVSRFTYTVTNYPGISQGVQANLYLCEDTVVAGDIFCTGENGFQTTLEFPQEGEKAA